MSNSISDIYGNAIPVASPYKAFVSKMLPVANSVSLQTGINPQVLLAQYEAEFNPNLAKVNNYGGIKYAGGSTPYATPSGQYSPSGGEYAGYKSLSQFAAGDAAFYLNNSNYSGLITGAQQGATPAQQIQAIASEGYASNPGYGVLLQSVYDAMFPGNGNALSLTPPPLPLYTSPGAGTPVTGNQGTSGSSGGGTAAPGILPALDHLLNSPSGPFGIGEWVARGFIGLAGIALIVVGVLVMVKPGININIQGLAKPEGEAASGE